MRTTIKILLCIFCIVLVSCEKTPNPGEATPPASSVTIMKFSNPSYVNNLIVNDYENIGEFILMRGNNCSSEYLNYSSGKDWTYSFPSIDNRTPYIELTDGWFLVDWSWYGYPYSGQILLTDVTWNTYNGEYTFDKDQPYISDNVFEKKGINVADLVAYSFPEGNYPTFAFCYQNKNGENDTIKDCNEYIYIEHLIGGKYYGGTPYLSDNEYCLCERVEEMDALWDLLRQQLINLISSGDLDNLPAVDAGMFLND